MIPEPLGDRTSPKAYPGLKRLCKNPISHTSLLRLPRLAVGSGEPALSLSNGDGRIRQVYRVAGSIFHVKAQKRLAENLISNPSQPRLPGACRTCLDGYQPRPVGLG
jgi:hypothetical protein